jgi:hypothetical protein
MINVIIIIIIIARCAMCVPHHRIVTAGVYNGRLTIRNLTAAIRTF